jgi:hypothetical protein
MSLQISSKHKIGLGLLAAALVAAVPVRSMVVRAQERTNLEQTPALDEEQGRGGGGGPVAVAPPEPMKFRYMGPAPAGRISAVVGVPGDATTYYLGNASGGVWKTTDSGATFKPVFDDQPVQAIGALAVSESDHNQVWAGTGESWLIRYSDVMGDGVYKSTDAGATWKNMGLKETGRIARVLIHPTNPNIVFVCAVGRTTGPQQERGVFKTTDGGATWKQTLFVNPDTGCSGLTLDPKNPNHMFAGTWEVQAQTWAEITADKPGGGIYESKDGGDTFQHVMAAGLPKDPIGKVDVMIAPSNGQRVYAVMQTKDQGSVWRSDDSGVTWNVTSWDRSLTGRAGYYIRLAVNPFNADDVLISSSSHHRSIDGGKNFSGNGGNVPNPGNISCGDCHDIWMDSQIEGRYALTDDGGASLAHGKGATPATTSVRLPNGQMYHIATDNRVPYWIYSNRQDDGTMRGPMTVSEDTANGVLPPGSRMQDMGVNAAAPAAAGRGGRGGGGGGRGGRGGPALAWQPNIGGCESGFTIPDPKTADIVWATCYGNKVTRWDARTNTAHSIEPWLITLDSAPNDAKYRCHWTAPIAVDPFDGKVYYGCQLIFATSNSGTTWTEFSPDLSTKDPSRIVSNGGLVGDNLGQWSGEVVWAIAPSTVQRGLIWAGTNDGKLWITKTANLPKATWIDITKNVTGLPTWSTISQIAPSTFDPGTAYIAVDKHLMDDRKPYIFKTTDFGATWKNITGNIPSGHPLDYTLSIAENPNKKGMLFAGTGHAFYYSMNDGQTWTQFKDGLPAAPVGWITVQKNFHDVVLSTYGRGLYIMPNITALEQTGQTSFPASEDKLYEPAPIYRQARSAFTQSGRPHFVFSLAKSPAAPLKLEILDAAGAVIRTLNVAGKAGLNGANWDLRYEAPQLVALKTTPPDNPHIWEEARFQNTDTRRITHWGITGTTGIPMAAPGKYQVRLTIDGKAMTQPFTVIKDPAVVETDANLVISTKLQVRLRDDITKTSVMVNQLELWRKQIEDQKKAKASDAGAVNVLGELDKVLWDTEMQLVSRSEIHSDDKYFPEAYKVYMNLIWLNGAVGQGASDEAGGVDWKPTDVQFQMTTMIEGQIAKAKLEMDKYKATTIPAFNAANAAKGLIIK